MLGDFILYITKMEICLGKLLIPVQNLNSLYKDENKDLKIKYLLLMKFELQRYYLFGI